MLCHLKSYHMRPLLAAILFVSVTSLRAQLTIQITSLPSNTPAGATLYFAGSSNNWNPADVGAKFVVGANMTTYSYTFTPPVGTVEYKVTRGSWATVEGNAAGNVIGNRSVTYSGAPKTVQITIAGWEGNNGGGGTTSTAAANVSILDAAFDMPQLGKKRRIWLYLPPDYNTAPQKHYPVLYVMDAQNAFDAATAPFGEWQIDEALNARFAAGDYGCIAIGIDHGGSDRLNEYSPWVNTQYGGGQGDEFLQFLTETLKPFVDTHYRTNPAPTHTALVGSSMGGLFAQYALTERQDVFGKAAVFSPAFWFAGNASRDQIIQEGKDADVRMYYLAGGQEPASVATDMSAVRNAMLQVGFPASELKSIVPTDGAHSEWFWRREFPAAYSWLFQGLNTSTGDAAATAKWKIYPNPAQQYISVKAPKNSNFQVTIYGTDGRKVKDWPSVGSGERLPISDLENGAWFMHITNGKAKAVRVFVKQ
jgi:predicted alpha/beta superfamily hydrolase